ncbi:MAG: hypothetical protein WCI03_04660 [bacterium]
MKRFIWLGALLSWVFLAGSFDAIAGARVKGSELATTCNIVGFVNKDVNSYVFAGCCYESISRRGPISLEELLGAQFSPGPDGDKVAMWDVTNQNYTEYMKAKDGRFYSRSRGMHVLVDTSVPVGAALWIIRKNPDSVITLAGQYSARAVITNSLVGATNYPANMICYPYPVDMSVQNFINTSHGAQVSDDPAKADKLTLWNARGLLDVQLGLKGDGKWHVLLGWATNAPSTRVIEMGEGVCFQASRPMMWVVRRPY